VTIDGTSAIFPTEPTYVDLVEHNFSGAAQSPRLFGATGVGKAFMFDGSAFTAITTGMSEGPGDKPTRIAVHKNRLFLAFGASLQFSQAADYSVWSVVVGAGEIAMGDPITAMATVVGGDQASAFVVGTDRGLAVLYGDTPDDFNLVWVSREMGVRPYSMQVLNTALLVNDFGVTSLSASQSFGNFQAASISASVQRFIAARAQRVTASALVRAKNQYRVFFDDGSALYFTLLGNKLVAITPARFDRVVRRVWTTLDASGAELILFASDDPYVYRMDVGRNFDGAAIDAYLLAAFNFLKSPRLRKAFKRLALEIEASSGYVAFQAGADVDYSGDDAIQSPARDVVNHVGGLWDEIVWDDFVWDTGDRQPSVVPVDGTGKNVALFVRCVDRTVSPFTITGVMTDWIARRQER